MKPVIVDKTTVVIISKIKFMPITPKIKKAPMLGNDSLTPLSRNGLKNIKLKPANIPVLITGTSTLAKTRPTYGFFFFIKENTKPAIKPAAVVFNKHVRTVPTGLKGMKSAKVEGEKRAIRPLKKPSIAPEIGPYSIAAITIVVKDKLILTGPNCK